MGVFLFHRSINCLLSSGVESMKLYTEEFIQNFQIIVKIIFYLRTFISGKQFNNFIYKHLSNTHNEIGAFLSITR